MIRLPLILLALLVSLSHAEAKPSPQAPWTETPALLDEWYVAESYETLTHVDPIAVRQGQQGVLFDTNGTQHIRMDVCLITPAEPCDIGSEGNEWGQLSSTRTLYPIPWSASEPDVPLPQVPGKYDVRMRYLKVNGPIKSFEYQLAVVPPAQRAFADTDGNSMILWQGATPAFDSPLFVVEGIDADNVNNPAHYYALANKL